MTGWYPNGIGLLWGPAGSQVAVTVRTPDGNEPTVTATRDSFSRSSPWVRDFPSYDPLEFRWRDDHVAYVALNTFGDRALEEQFDSIAPELHGATGVIIDVRRNSGGSNGIPRRITARHLTTDTLAGARWRTRINNAAHRAWGRWEQEYEPYFTRDAWDEVEPNLVIPDTSVPKLHVPIVVLIGRNTGSAAEDFLVWPSGRVLPGLWMRVSDSPLDGIVDGAGGSTKPAGHEWQTQPRNKQWLPRRRKRLHLRSDVAGNLLS